MSLEHDPYYVNSMHIGLAETFINSIPRARQEVELIAMARKKGTPNHPVAARAHNYLVGQVVSRFPPGYLKRIEKVGIKPVGIVEKMITLYGGHKV